MTQVPICKCAMSRNTARNGVCETCDGHIFIEHNEAPMRCPGSGQVERRIVVITFAIDYDKTYTLDPGAFRAIVCLLKNLGHRCVLVTGRSGDGQWGQEVRDAIGDLMPIVFADGSWKATAAERAGYKIDVWIDDMPEGIRELRADFAAEKRNRDAIMGAA